MSLSIADKVLIRNLLASALHQCPVVYGRTCARCVKHEGALYCLVDVQDIMPIDSMVSYVREADPDDGNLTVKSYPKVEPPKGCPHRAAVVL